MLSIGKLGQGQEAYYVETVARGAEEYYLGAGEAPGRWVGRSAGRLGLDGEVDGDDLASLLGHLDPRTDAPLTGGRCAPKVAGFDLTFCAPKSVSLVWAFATADVAAQIVEAHEAAADAALTVMETECFAGAVGTFKNPPSHRQVDYDDPTEASEVVMLADLLMRILNRL